MIVMFAVLMTPLAYLVGIGWWMKAFANGRWGSPRWRGSIRRSRSSSWWPDPSWSLRWSQERAGSRTSEGDRRASHRS